MQKNLLILFLLAAFGASAQTDKRALEQALFNLPDVSFQLISAPGVTPLQYELMIRQPLDHKHPELGSFYQLARLTHHGFDRPTVMSTQGYQIFLGKSEIEAMFDANHINIEHRYFGKSVPDSIQYQYLTLEQVCADLHHINQLFRQLYKGKWISSGISKGGQTTIFYRYFYPNDVEVSIPYVAPFNKGYEDKRIYQFLDTIGSPECRRKIFETQKFLLQHEEEALERLKWYAEGAGHTFNYLGDLGKAYEYAVLEYSFSFWQWGSKCEDLPSGDALDPYLQSLLKVSNIDFFADKSMTGYASHYYQAATEMGYYGYNIEPFKPWLKHFSSNPSAIFSPLKEKTPKYDNSLNEKVDKWLESQGNNFIYIYGANDTWSADRITPSKRVNSKSYILPGKDHGQARIRNLSSEMKQDLQQTLHQWLGIQPDMTVFK